MSACFTETTGFVDKLFECLTTKIYLGNPAAKEESKIPVQKLEEKEEVKPVLCHMSLIYIHQKCASGSFLSFLLLKL